MSEPVDSHVSARGAVRLAADVGNGQVRDQYLSGLISVLGSGNECDVILDADSVEKTHAAIVMLSGCAYLCDLGAPTGTSLNGRRIRWSRLATDDVLSIGPFDIKVQVETPNGAGEKEHPVFSLRCDEAIGVISSIDPVLVVGSDPGCDVVLYDEAVCPQHCLVAWTDEGPVVRNLAAANRTRLNDHEVNLGRLLNSDVIGVGPYELAFETQSRIAGGRPEGASGAKKGLSSGNVLVAGRLSSERVSEEEAACMDDRAMHSDPIVILRDQPFDEEWEALRGAAQPFLSERDAMSDGEAEHDWDDIDVVDVERAELLAAMEASEAAAMAESDILAPPENLMTTDVNMIEAESLEAVEASDAADVFDVDEESQSEDAEVLDRDDALRPEGEDVLGADVTEESAMSNEQEKTTKDESSVKPSTQKMISSRTERLEEKTEELRQRVAAAQRALDERARKHREGLAEERRRLEIRRADLRRQAAALLDAARSKSSSEASDIGELKSLDDIVPSQSQIESLLSGEIELAEALNSRATERPVMREDSISRVVSAKDLSLEERAAELIEVAKRERLEIEKGESLIESLRFETERRRTTLARREEKLLVREEAIEEQFAAIEKAHVEIQAEREPLVERLRQLEKDEAMVETQRKEAERVRVELDREADSVRDAQEKLEKRRTELLDHLESERYRLQLRQAELHRKAAELAEAARAKRLLVEAEMSERQSALQAEEELLKAKRQEIEAAARRELDRTAGELEQVLQLRLSDIEQELISRKEDLDHRLMEITNASPKPRMNPSPAAGSIEDPLRAIAEELNGKGGMSRAPKGRTGGEKSSGGKRGVSGDRIKVSGLADSGSDSTLRMGDKKDGAGKIIDAEKEAVLAGSRDAIDEDDSIANAEAGNRSDEG